MATTHLLATGKIVEGEIQWRIAPLPTADEAKDGIAQAMIDQAHAETLAEEWQDHFLDQEFYDHWL